MAGFIPSCSVSAKLDRDGSSALSGAEQLTLPKAEAGRHQQPFEPRREAENDVEIISIGGLQAQQRLGKNLDKIVQGGRWFGALSPPKKHFKLPLQAV